MKRINFLTTIFLMAMPLFYLSQRECYNTVSFCDTDSKGGFTRNMQSLSGAFVPGDTNIVQIIVYKNMEYRVSLCSPSHPDLQGKFQFKIIEFISLNTTNTQNLNQIILKPGYQSMVEI